MNPLSLVTNKFIQALILKAARAGIMALGGWVVRQGLATGDQATSLEGSLIFLAGFGFSVIDALAVKKKIAVALATPVPQPPAPAPQATMAPIPNP